MLKLNTNLIKNGRTQQYSNTTLVKVKYSSAKSITAPGTIQIQHLLKLNARKINLYDFHYTIKSIDIQGF